MSCSALHSRGHTDCRPRGQPHSCGVQQYCLPRPVAKRSGQRGHHVVLAQEAGYAQWASVATAPTSPGLQTVAAQAGLVKNRVVKNRKGLFRIRHLQESDLLPVAQLQASSFYESPSVKLFDQLAFTMFRAEVLSAVQKKTQVLAEDGFTILVVESCSPAAGSWAGDASLSSSSSSSSGSSDFEAAVWYGDQQAAAAERNGSPLRADSSAAAGSSNILGVIEVGVQDEQDVLQHLPTGMETYAYISSMAVAPHMRRCGIGAALLQAAEQQAVLWGQQLVALHVYETNERAMKLYQSHGLVNHASDPAWRKYVGGKVRQLMVKWV